MTEANIRHEKPRMPRLRLAAIAIAIGFLGASIYWDFRPFEFKPFHSGHTFGMITKLMLISAFMERTMEFFISVWRKTEKIHMVKEVENYENEISEMEVASASRKEKIMEMEILKRAMREYTGQTMRISMWISFVFGIAISAAGVRAIEPLFSIDIAALEIKNVAQYHIFFFVDILLTGGLISGGSEGIHKIAATYNNFWDATAKRARKQKKR